MAWASRGDLAGRVTFLALGNSGTGKTHIGLALSKPLFLEIAWDGLWSDDAVEMRTHLVVKTVSGIEGHPK